MIKYNKLILVLIISVLLIFVFFACDDPVDLPEPEEEMTILEGVESVLAAVDNTNNLVNEQGMIYIDITAFYKDGSDEYDIIFDANLDPTGQNNASNKMRFEIKDSNSQIYVAIYYFNETLYIQVPNDDGTSEKRFIENFNMSSIVTKVLSAASFDLSAIKNSLAAPIDSMVYEINGDNLSVEFNISVPDAISTFISLFAMGIDDIIIDDILGMVGFDLEGLYTSLDDYRSSSLIINLEDSYFSSLNFNNNNGVSFAITGFHMDNSQQEINIPNVNAFEEFSVTNIDVSGKLILDIESGDYTNPIDDVDLIADLQDASYEFDFRLRSNMNLLAPQNDRLLIEISIYNDCAVSIYYEGATQYIYMDLTDINSGKIKIKANDLQSLINSSAEEVNESEVDDGINLDSRMIMTLLGIITPGASISSSSAEVELDTDRITDLFAAFGVILPLEISNAGANIGINNYDVESLSAWMRVGGITLSLESESIAYGNPPSIPVLADASSYMDTEDIEIFTVFLEGDIDFSTAQIDLFTYLEMSLYHITGENIELTYPGSLSDNMVKYEAKVGINAEDGSLSILEIDLYDAMDQYIMGITYLDETKKVYVLQEITQGEDPVYDVGTYDLNYNAVEFFEIITGIVDPVIPSIDSGINISNLINKLTLDFNYNAFVSFIDFIGNVFFDEEELFSSDYVFENIEFSINQGLNCKMTFGDGIYLEANAVNMGLDYTSVSFVGIAESDTRSLSTPYLNNNMPDVLTLEFSDGSHKKMQVNEWTYDTDGYNNNTNGVVVATTFIMGNEINITLNVNGSSVSSFRDTPPSEGLIFDKNDLTNNPIDVINSYNSITIRTDLGDYDKELYWDLDNLEDANYNGVYEIYGLVYDFFGRPRLWPSESMPYEITIVGTDIIGHSLDMNINAYDGIDPTDMMSYPGLAVLQPNGIITTDQGAVGELLELEWDLSNIIDIYNAPDFQAYQQGVTTEISVNIPNSMGVERCFDVNLVINPAVMQGLSFDGVYLSNGLMIDDGLSQASDASGISWDSVNERLVINPLRIRELNESILPSSVLMHTQAGDYMFDGLKWEFKPLVIDNNGGIYTERLNLIIGDTIGGYQERFVTIEIAAITITDFQLLNNDEEIIDPNNVQDIDGLYKEYTIVNPYNYYMPEKTKIYTALGDFVLPTNWSFPTLIVSNLYNGGQYEGTYQAGSQELRTRIVVEPAIAVMSDGLTFRVEDTSIIFDETKGLVFNPYTSDDFKDLDIYPTTALAKFTNGQAETRELEIPVRWDITNVIDQYSQGNPNLYLGKRIEVRVYTNYAGCGSQLFNSYIYIEEAVIDAGSVVYSLANPTQMMDLSIFGNDGGLLTFTDPRIQSSYPEYIRVSYNDPASSSRIIPMFDEDVEVHSWNISSIINAYDQTTIISGISGTFDIIATVGTSRGGYQYITMQVNIVSSELENVVFKDIPLMPSGEPAFIYDNTIGDDYIATFTFDPYKADVKNSISYPKSMGFDLEIDGTVYPFDNSLDWDLQDISGITPYEGGEYYVQARLPLSDTGYLPISLRILINEKTVDTLDGEGLFNIFVDPLSSTPFGRRNTISSLIRQSVEVTFNEDSSVMTLYLIYNREDILVDFGGALYLIDAQVGNDFGGYQPIGIDGKVNLGVIQQDVESIYAYNDTDNLIEIFRREATQQGEVYIIEETNPNTFYYLNKPQSIFVTFTNSEGPIEIALKTPSTTGLCYDWIEIDQNTIQIVIHNVITAFLDEEGDDTVFANNPYGVLEVIQLQDVTGLLFQVGQYGLDYQGSNIDILTNLINHNAILNDSLGIADEFLEYEYYYEGELLVGDVYDSGIYTLRIYVKGHSVYGGYDEVDFTVYQRDQTDRLRIFRDGVQVNNIGESVVETVEYNGNPVEYTADIEGYVYDVVVVYPDASGNPDLSSTAPVDVGIYNIILEISSDYPNEIINATIELTISKVNLNQDSSDVAISYTQVVVYGSSLFEIEMTVYGEVIVGFDYDYYEDMECSIPISHISIIDVGTYYVQVTYSGLNYDLVAVKSFEVVPAVLDQSDYLLNVYDMSDTDDAPDIELTILGQLRSIALATITYYDDAAATNQIDITTVPEGNYYAKVEYTIDNYESIEPIGSFYKINS